MSNGRSCVHGPNGGLVSWTPPTVAIRVVRLACERPALLGRSLSPWDGTEPARQRIAAGLVEDIAASTVRRILAAYPLKPWCHHLGWYPKPPRAGDFYATGSELIDRYTRPLHKDDMLLSRDAKTSLPPRPWLASSRPAPPQNVPPHYEHEYTRAGTLHLLAAFATRSGRVYGPCDARKRQQECLAFLEYWDQERAAHIRTIHLRCDHVSTHHGKDVTQWFATHPRVVMHCTLVHGSWMNHGEPWFSILQRKRLRIVDVESKPHPHAKIKQFIHAWHHQAHLFNWSTKAVAKVKAAAPARAA